MKIRTILLTVVCIICTLPALADFTDGDFTFSENGSDCTLTDYHGSGGAVTVPSIATKMETADNDTIVTQYTVTSIGSSAFAYCWSLRSVTVQGSLTCIEQSAFYVCSLETITVQGSVTSIEKTAFYACNRLETVTITGGVTSIEDNAFASCDLLASVSFIDGVTSIGVGAFSSCYSLTSITIPGSATSIGEGAFGYCRGLTDVTVEWATPLAIQTNTFTNVSLGTATLHVPTGTKALYKAAEVWKEFGTIDDGTVSVTGISLSESSITLYARDTVQLTATVTPPDALDKTIIWTSDNTTVATVDTSGWVAAVSAGTAVITATTQDGNETATCHVTVVAPGMPELIVPTATLDFTASGETIIVSVASNISWTTDKDMPWITVSPASGSNNDTIRITVEANTTTSQRTGTVIVSGGGIMRTIAVTQAAMQQQQIVVEPEQPEGNQGVVDVFLQIPTNETFHAEFTFGLPEGFKLDSLSTSLNAELSDRYAFAVMPYSIINGWIISIYPKALRAASDITYQQVMRIAYTIDETVETGEYEITFSDIKLTLNNGEVIQQGEIAVPVTVTSTVGNAPVDVTGIRYVNGQLYVDTPVAERIAVYSPNGIQLYQARKQPGMATFNLSSLPQGVLIVYGSSGWTKKVYSKR